MLKCKAVICSEQVIRDTESNTITAVNIIEELHSPIFPVAIPRFTAVFMLEKDEADNDQQEVRVVIKLGDAQINETPVNLNFQQKKSNRLIVSLNGLVLPSPGLLIVKLLHAGGEFSSWGIPVSQIGGPQPAVAQG